MRYYLIILFVTIIQVLTCDSYAIEHPPYLNLPEMVTDLQTGTVVFHARCDNSRLSIPYGTPEITTGYLTHGEQMKVFCDFGYYNNGSNSNSGGFMLQNVTSYVMTNCLDGIFTVENLCVRACLKDTLPSGQVKFVKSDGSLENIPDGAIILSNSNIKYYCPDSKGIPNLNTNFVNLRCSNNSSFVGDLPDCHSSWMGCSINSMINFVDNHTDRAGNSDIECAGTGGCNSYCFNNPQNCTSDGNTILHSKSVNVLCKTSDPLDNRVTQQVNVVCNHGNWNPLSDDMIECPIQSDYQTYQDTNENLLDCRPLNDMSTFFNVNFRNLGNNGVLPNYSKLDFQCQDGTGIDHTVIYTGEQIDALRYFLLDHAIYCINGSYYYAVDIDITDNMKSVIESYGVSRVEDLFPSDISFVPVRKVICPMGCDLVNDGVVKNYSELNVSKSQFNHLEKMELRCLSDQGLKSSHNVYYTSDPPASISWTTGTEAILYCIAGRYYLSYGNVDFGESLDDTTKLVQDIYSNFDVNKIVDYHYVSYDGYFLLNIYTMQCIGLAY